MNYALLRSGCQCSFALFFCFVRKKPPVGVGWRVHAKMTCNAMQMCIEWRMDKIQDAIKSLRRTLSQSEIARRTGIAQHKISRWESGNIPAGASDALKLIELAKEVAAATPAKEARLVNWALQGQFKGLDRDALSAADLALLCHLEERNAVLIGRGLSYDQRKPMMKQYAMDWRLAHGGALTATEAAE